ncbi:hypothetical protein GYH30_040021 [Glycine max]|uniref:Uncharacterized protein n=1 Tax=Glycine max TaxID=3847 RepID=A0A0R0GDH5_SOYBN|nr:hypothetical protein GYH30_040021 [Glycine max]
MLQVGILCTLNLSCPANLSNMRKQVGTQESMRSVGVIGLSLLSNCDSDDDDASLYDIYCRMKWRFDLLEMVEGQGREDENLYESMFSTKEEHREKKA